MGSIGVRSEPEISNIWRNKGLMAPLTSIRSHSSPFLCKSYALLTLFVLSVHKFILKNTIKLVSDSDSDSQPFSAAFSRTLTFAMSYVLRLTCLVFLGDKWSQIELIFRIIFSLNRYIRYIWSTICLQCTQTLLFCENSLQKWLSLTKCDIKRKDI